MKLGHRLRRVLIFAGDATLVFFVWANLTMFLVNCAFHSALPAACSFVAFVYCDFVRRGRKK